jgi:hypothetical protein
MLAQKALRHLYLRLRSNSTWGSSDSTGLEHRNSIRYESSPFNSQRSLTLGYRFSDNGLNYEMYELSAYWNMHTNETQGNSKKTWENDTQALKTFLKNKIIYPFWS